MLGRNRHVLWPVLFLIGGTFAACSGGGASLGNSAPAVNSATASNDGALPAAVSAVSSLPTAERTMSSAASVHVQPAATEPCIPGVLSKDRTAPTITSITWNPATQQVTLSWTPPTHGSVIAFNAPGAHDFDIASTKYDHGDCVSTVTIDREVIEKHPGVWQFKVAGFALGGIFHRGFTEFSQPASVDTLLTPPTPAPTPTATPNPYACENIPGTTPYDFVPGGGTFTKTGPGISATITYPSFEYSNDGGITYTSGVTIPTACLFFSTEGNSTYIAVYFQGTPNVNFVKFATNNSATAGITDVSFKDGDTITQTGGSGAYQATAKGGAAAFVSPFNGLGHAAWSAGTSYLSITYADTTTP